MLLKKISIKFFLEQLAILLFYILTIEVFLLGSGNLIRFDFFGLSISLRMILFVLCSLTLLLLIVFFKDHRVLNFKHIALSLIPICFLLYYTFVGLIMKNDLNSLWHDIKKYLFVSFGVLVVISNIWSKINKDKFKFVLYIVSLLISVVSITTFFLTNYFGVDLYSFLHMILPRYEIVKRVNGGGIYLPAQISTFLVLIYQLFEIFVLKRDSKICIALSLINLVCMLQTSTRSFLLVIIPYFSLLAIYSCIKTERNTQISNFRNITIFIFVIAFMARFTTFERITSTTEPGSGKRFEYLQEILQNASLFGKGFGSSLNSIGHSDLEIPFLEMLYEGGIIGLLGWFIYFVALAIILIKNKKSGEAAVLIALLIASFGNPYLLTPMGWFAIVLVIVRLSDLPFSSQIPNQNPVRD